jgi:hypothetical protein
MGKDAVRSPSLSLHCESCLQVLEASDHVLRLGMGAIANQGTPTSHVLRLGMGAIANQGTPTSHS